MHSDAGSPEIQGVPEGVDISTPSAARVYDWYLGGDHNWESDREFGKLALRKFPLIQTLARHNRMWLRRVVRAALDAGVTQFLDLGSGMPTVGNVHDVVTQHSPDSPARVVYVDNEPVAATYANVVLERAGATGWAGVVQGDLRSPERVLGSETVGRLLDFDEPICVLSVAVLHFVGGDDDVPSILRGYTSLLAPGSWLAISHIANDAAAGVQAEQVQALVDAYRNTQTPGYLRGRDEVRSWFDGLRLAEPGIVALPEWGDGSGLPDADEIRDCAWCGVGVTD